MAKLGLLPETDVEFEIDDNAVRIRKAESGRRGKSVVAALRGRATGKLTPEEIMALTRGPRATRRKRK